MRVSIIGPAYPLRGGIAHHVYWLRQELTARGHNVQVISFRKLYPSIFFPGTTEMDRSGLKLDPGALPILSPLNPASWFGALKKVKSFSPDAVIFQWWQPFFGPLVGTLARLFRRSGIPCIIECHNIFPHESTPLDKLLLNFGLSSADHLIVHSMKDRKDLQAIVGQKECITTFSLPTLDEFANSCKSSRAGRTILFFGKVRKYKGLDVLLAALPKVLSRVECRLNVVGEFYDSISKYQNLIRTYGLESHVHLDNRYVPNEEVPAVFERADVLVLPYLSATQSAVARIALSNGLPLIVSGTGGLTEVVEENVTGFSFPPGDSDALADRIATYFESNLGPAFSENIKKGATEDSNRHLGNTIEEIIYRSCSVKRVAAST